MHTHLDTCQVWMTPIHLLLCHPASMPRVTLSSQTEIVEDGICTMDPAIFTCYTTTLSNHSGWWCNVPGYGILPPGPQPTTSLAAQDYLPHPYNQPPPHQQQQHPIPGHGGSDSSRECNRECKREWERKGEHGRQFTMDPTSPHLSNFTPHPPFMSMLIGCWKRQTIDVRPRSHPCWWMGSN